MLVQQFIRKAGCVVALTVLSSTSVLAYDAPVESRTGSVPELTRNQDEYVDNSVSPGFQPVNSFDSSAVPTQQPVYADEEPKTQMLDKIAHLEQDVRELRGLVEEQGHTIKRLEKQLSQNVVTAAPPAPTMANVSTEKSDDVSSPAVAAVSKDNEQKIYQDAYTLLRNKQYGQAIPAMSAYLKSYPSGQYAVNAHYWLGELSLIQGDEKMAHDQFSQLVKKFPSSPKVPDAMLKIGTIYAEQKQWQNAKVQFKDIVSRYPESSAAKLADQRLQQLEMAGH